MDVRELIREVICVKVYWDELYDKIVGRGPAGIQEDADELNVMIRRLFDFVKDGNPRIWAEMKADRPQTFYDAEGYER